VWNIYFGPIEQTVCPNTTGHHDSFGKLKVTIIDHNPKWDDKSRQERESFWIRKLKTLSPNGINEKK
jgi:hypothetical protein